MKKVLLGALIFFLLLIPTLVIILWLNLDWIVTEARAKQGVAYLKQDVQWAELKIDIQNQGFWGKNIVLSTKDFCFNSRPVLEMCLSHADLRLHFEVLFSKPFVALDQVFVDATFAKLNVQLPADKPDDKPRLPFVVPRWDIGSLQDLVAPYLKKAPLAVIEKISVHLPKAEVQVSSEMKIVASADITSTQQRVDLDSQTQVIRTGADALDLKLQAGLQLTEPLALQGSVDLQWGKQSHALQFAWKDFPRLELVSKMPLAQGQANYRLLAELKKQEWLMSHTADLRSPQLPFQLMELQECSTKLVYEDGLPKNLSWPCQIVMKRIKKPKLVGLPDSLFVKSSLLMPIHFSGNVATVTPQLEIQLNQNPLAEFKAESSATVVMQLETKQLQKVNLEGLSLGLKIPAFENISRILARSLWAMPAPVAVLRGPLELQVSAPFSDLLKKNFQVSAQMNTDLTSQRQKLKTQTTSQFDIDLSKPLVSIKGDMSLQDIRLELPYIGVEAPPQFKPDSRFVKGSVSQQTQGNAKPPLVELTDFTFQTADRPILLYTRLLPNPVPVNVKYQVQKPMSLSGAISIGKMDFEVFRKKAVVERFNVTKYRDSTIQDLDGLITHRTSEVKIEILVVGTTEKPRIEFLSDPPLSRQQIISILLFNKSLQQLADDEKSTAGQLDQALLSEAFGLASLFLLSSTPIESVYFDPTTQSYVARVKIDESTSVSLGSDFDASKQVTLRRRLGGPWSISTALQQSKNSEDIVTTLIEWFRRF